VAEFEQEQFYQSNIDVFNGKFGYPKQTVRVLGPNNGGYFGEGNLDLEYINTLASGVETWWVAKNEFDLVGWCQRVLTLQPPPSTLSISWGSGESGYDAQTADAVNAEFRKLGLLGLSVLSASGDQGTGSTGLFSCGTFDPTFPASSPYVTSVGGTYADSASSAETGWHNSGGGFSTFFSAPSYQNKTVPLYLANTSDLPSQQYFAASGRGIPDVSAVSCNFEVYSSGWGSESGTSAATPTFASIITRINAERVAAGKPLLGFLNPRLYELGKVGYDVTDGDNQNPSCPQGFPARVGWDAVTGLGTPSYPFLRQNI
jgi:tripeptidyl-peptidase-1